MQFVPLGPQFPNIRYINIGTAETFNRRAAKQPKSAFHVCSQNRQGLSDAGPSGSRESVSISTSDQNGASAETNCFDHIAPAPDPTIHHDFNLAIHRMDNLLECPH